jgi:hypothetical protein
MSTDPFNFDDVPDDVHESQDSLTSLSNALTEHHHNTNHEGPFTLKTTTASSYVSHSDAEGLSSDEVGRLLASDLTPWSVDWIGLSFPVKNLALEPPFPWIELHSNGVKWARIWETSFEIEQGTVDLKVTQKGNALSGYLNFNPTTCMYGPKSVYVARLDDALDVTSTVLEAVNEWVTPDCRPEEMLLSRVDVNLTTERVADMQRLLSIVKNAPSRGVTPLATYGKGGRLESVVRRSKRSGGFCIYDKGLQAGIGKPFVRFEVNARRSRLRDLCPTLGDLTDERLRAIAQKSLRPVIDTLLLAPRNAVADVLADKKQTSAFIEMVGLATLADLGHHPYVSPYALRKKYNPILNRYSARTVGDLLN